MKRLLLFSILVLFLAVQVSWGQIPETISYQGVLTDGTGSVVPDGNHSLTFALYEVSSGGTALWIEAHGSVAVADGVFSLILGNNNPLSIAFDRQYWLGVTVDGGAELTPRIQLTSSAYSLNTRSVADDIVWYLTGNAGTDPGTNFLGTTDDQPLVLRANDLRVMLLQPHAVSPNVIAGYSGNSAAPGVYGATIGGGGGGSQENSVTANYGTVVGGSNNEASGEYATVAGGEGNVAEGQFSFAAGHRAKATYNGCFVWGDSTDDDVHPNGPNRFVARAAGGTWFYSNAARSAGVRLPAGSSAWATVSDRDLKRNIRPVDGRDVLAKLAQMPISRWSYKSQTPDIEHIGPMAQDFHTAFGLGDDNRHISTIDPDGVALAAIQGLYELVKEKDSQLEAQKQQCAELQQKVDDLEMRLKALEALMKQNLGSALERGYKSEYRQ